MTDIVERLRFASACSMSVGEEIGRHLVEEAADEITRLRLQLSLQKEKLPSPQDIRGVSQTAPGPLWSGDWRDLPEAP